MTSISWACILCGVYACIFWGVEREDFLVLFSLFTVAFIFQLFPFSSWGSGSRPLLFVGTGLIIRIMAVSSLPTLSEDIYRYIWDGYLSQEGISPYAYTPDECINLFSIQEHPLIHSLYPHLNSASYYSVYPPAAQTFFTFGGWLGALWGIAAAVIGLKSLFYMVELGAWIVLYKLFEIQKTDDKWFWALWLNPFLILEWNFSGHIESLTASFIIAGVFLLQMKKNYLSGLLLALAVLVKLWPLLFAPFFMKYIKTSKELYKWISAFILIGVIGSLAFLLQPEYFIHFKSSLDLYFKTFEFNASVYYLFRAIGIWWYGYNPIHLIGPLCAFIMMVFCIFLYRTRIVLEIPQLMDSILLCGFVYLLFATTVHPWYLSIILPFAYLNGRISIIIWSYLIFASYHAYRYDPVKEDLLIIVSTYSIVIMAILIEFKMKKPVIQ